MAEELYSGADLDDGENKSFFAPEDIHTIIVEHGFSKGSEFAIKKVAHQNGKRCLSEAVEIVHSLPDIPFQGEDINAICSGLFIERTK